jgi:DNA-binding response OmpR family regulator
MRATKTLSTVENPCLLLVDDGQPGTVARKQILEENGFCVTVAESIAQGLVSTVAGGFQIAVINHQPPVFDGVEMVRQLRASQTTMRLILISGIADTLGLTEMNTGADIVIQKNSNECATLIRSALRLARRRPTRKPPLRIAATASAVAHKG